MQYSEVKQKWVWKQFSIDIKFDFVQYTMWWHLHNSRQKLLWQRIWLLALVVYIYNAQRGRTYKLHNVKLDRNECGNNVYHEKFVPFV